MPVSLNNVSQVNNTQAIKQPEKKTDEKSKFLTPTKTKIAVGTALTALAAVGIYLATKGKGNKATQEAVTEATHNIQETVPETVNTIKEMTVDAFRQAGNKFNKGKAVTSTGEVFTGSLTHQTKDGKNIVREYENGVLKKATKYEGENVLSQKEYKYDKNGKISEVLLSNKGRINMQHDTTAGKISIISSFRMNSPMAFYYSKEGALKYMTCGFKDIPQKLRGVASDDITSMLIEFDPLTKKPIRACSAGLSDFRNNKSIFYDKSGKPSMIMYREQGPENLHFKDLRNNQEVKIIRHKDGAFETGLPYDRYEMQVDTKDSLGIICFDLPYFNHEKPDDIRLSLYKKKKNSKKKDRYTLSLKNLKSETADYSINGKKVAKYNVKTGDIEMLPDCGVSSDTVKAQLDELGSQYRMIKKYYRNAYKYKNKQADLTKAIEKSLEDYGDKDFWIPHNACSGIY